MKFVCKRSAVSLGAALVLASGAWAQELRGRIAGVVTDNSGAVLSGVTITVSSPALIQPQTTTSRPDGSYQFPALPSGVYTAVFSMTGFQTVRRDGIRVNLNTTLTIDSQLQLASMAEELSVTAESPVVDITNTNIGTSFTKELLTDIPNARDLWAALSQAPGFQMAGYDVGGSHTGTQTTYTTYGVTGDNKTLLEGINVTESRDANAGYFDYGSFEEFQVGGSGNMGEAAGAALDGRPHETLQLVEQLLRLRPLPGDVDALLGVAQEVEQLVLAGQAVQMQLVATGAGHARDVVLGVVVVGFAEENT